MFDFCPHCGQTIEHEQVKGQMLVCANCGLDIGFAGSVDRAIIDESAQLIRTGKAALCPQCRQVVEVKSSNDGKRFVPHYQSKDARKICSGSGKATPAPSPITEPKPSAGKDLSAHMARDVIKVIYCPREGEPRIEVLTLRYLDKSERVRVQIEALREMMGGDFRMKEIPADLKKPHLAMWTSIDGCVVAMKHEKGGYQSIGDDDVAAMLAELRNRRDAFFA